MHKLLCRDTFGAKKTRKAWWLSLKGSSLQIAPYWTNRKKPPLLQEVRNQSYTGLNALAIRYEKKPKKRIRSELLHCFRKKKTDTFRENTWLTLASVRARKVRLWTPRRWKKGKALPRGMPPERGKEGMVRNLNSPRTTQSSLAGETGNKELSWAYFSIAKNVWGRSFCHSPVQTLYITKFSSKRSYGCSIAFSLPL